MDEPTAQLEPVSTRSLTELLEDGPLPMDKGLEMLGVIAGAMAKLHASGRTHGLVTASIIRVSTFENGPPLVLFLEQEATRDMSPGADQFALGVLACQVLSGRVPKPSESFKDLVPHAPPALEKLVAKLTAPKPSERLSAAGAQRQFLDLASTLAEPGATAVAPLAAKPQLKKRPEPNPFSDDEATVAGSPSGPEVTADGEGERLPELTPPPAPARPLAGPALEDEPTQFAPVKWNRKKEPPRAHTPLPPPVPTPGESEATPLRRSGDEPTREAFEPSRSDLPGNTGEQLADPRLSRRPRRREASGRSPMSGFVILAKKQPPWIWGAVGVGLAFFVLLLIALAR